MLEDAIRRPDIYSLINCVYVNSLFQGLKRSVTTLRGGTLGYAEIVAVKVRDFVTDSTSIFFCINIILMYFLHFG